MDSAITDIDVRVSLNVTGRPDITLSYRRGVTIAPDTLIVTYRWNCVSGYYFTGAEVGGRRRLVNRGLGSRSSTSYLSPERQPEWMVQMIADNTPPQMNGARQ